MAMSDMTRRVLFCVGLMLVCLGVGMNSSHGEGAFLTGPGGLLLGLAIPLPSKAK